MDELVSNLAASYPDWLAILLAGAVISFVATGAVLRIKSLAKFSPEIRDRDVHTERKSRLGGVAMWLSFSILGVLLFLGRSDLGFGQGTIWGIDRVLLGIGLGMGVVLVTGLIDDIKGLSPLQQLGAQFLAATAVIWGGVQMELIRLPLGGVLSFTAGAFDLPSWLGGGVVYPLGAFLTYVWVMVIINVMNFFDGLDGLAGSVAAMAATVMFAVCVVLGLPAPAMLALLLAGVTLGFLPWNWHPSRLFMGTVGSQMLGFVLAVTAIVSGSKVATAVLVLGIPVLDAVVVVGRRLLAGVSPFTADQRHLHHRLLKLGMPVPWVVVTITSIAGVFGYLALRTQNAQGKGVLTLILVGAMFLVILATYLLERRAARRVN